MRNRREIKDFWVTKRYMTTRLSLCETRRLGCHACHVACSYRSAGVVHLRGARLWTRNLQGPEKHDNKNEQPNSHDAHIWVVRIHQRRPSRLAVPDQTKVTLGLSPRRDQRARRTVPALKQINLR